MKEIDTEKIRGLLEKAERLSVGMGASTAKDDRYFVLLRVREALSLLPPPCSECGGSGKCLDCKGEGTVYGRTGFDERMDWCEKCNGTGKCPACQPAGEIDEDVEKCEEAHRFSFSYALEARDVRWLKEACDHLTALLKRCEQLEGEKEGIKEALRLYRQDDLSAEEENEKYNKPCPYNEAVMCIQYPEDSCGCDPCKECETKLKAAEKLAKSFHEAYERLAPDFGYKTREASAKPWKDVPENNKQLMIAVCKEILPAYPDAKQKEKEDAD